MSESQQPLVAVIGGSGFYEFLADAREVNPSTPYGEPSAPIAIGDVGGRAVAFLPRHGKSHEFPPHKINYRANIWALRSLGVRQVFAPCAVGGLQASVPPGSVVVPDQLVDRTQLRQQTYMDTGAVHLPFADPYCPTLRAALAKAGDGVIDGVIDGGTMVVIEGPRFSTRAESKAYAASGWDLINMTGHPEAVLARELGLCYAALALVTDSDAGVEVGEGVDQASVFATFAEHIAGLKTILRTAIGGLGDQPCTCADWLDDVALPFELP